MATAATSSPALSPPSAGKSISPPLPPLNTSVTPRRTGSNRPTSYAQRRISTYSSTSRSNAAQSRPVSQVFPAFHSSLSYTLVRDFAYLVTHPLHYGPQPDASGTQTPASESRRLSDPAVATWEDSRNNWSATPSWLAESNSTSTSKDQLPAMTFNDGGPPYSEDDDLQSPVVTTSRHRKNRSTSERGRSPGDAGPHRSIVFSSNADQIEEYHPTDSDDLNGPGGEIEAYPTSDTHRNNPRHRDSNFALPLQRNQPALNYIGHISDEEHSDDGDDDARYSKDYSFTIASPDEEMHGKAVALFDFAPEHENELGLKEGQIILVSYRHGQGWLVAEDPQSGESGLVPEEFVRLVKDIEGGLNGLHAVNVNVDTTNLPDVSTPVSTDTGSVTTPVPSNSEFNGGHATKPSNGSNCAEKHPAVQSTFSTSSRDFSPFPRPGNEAPSPTKEYT